MYSWKERSVAGSCRWLLRNLLRAICVWTGPLTSARPDAASASSLEYVAQILVCGLADHLSSHCYLNRLSQTKVVLLQSSVGSRTASSISTSRCCNARPCESIDRM